MPILTVKNRCDTITIFISIVAYTYLNIDQIGKDKYMAILLTGGAGFIGSHTAVALLNENKEIIIADNFSNSDISVIDNIKKITKKEFKFYIINVLDKKALSKIFTENQIEAVIHFAGFKSVNESIEKPLIYYQNNIGTTIALLETMQKFNCKKIIFSSSATVYGANNKSPLTEDMKIGEAISNPYGKTKFMIEEILFDLSYAQQDWSVILLRYFNPVGADKSGLIGEKPSGKPNNLMPFITQAAMGIQKVLTIFGKDYDTYDGTCIRDFIHVSDLAKGHVLACEYALKHEGLEAVNLGTGKGISVLELIETFKRVNNVDVPYVIGDRRPGDLAEVYSDANKAKRLLNWQAEKTVEDMCRDSWNWECQNKK